MSNKVNVNQPLTNIVKIASIGPQGPAGAQGPSGSQGAPGISDINTGSLGDTTITGSLTVSGSGTLTNIGPFSQTGNSTFDGNITLSGSLTVSGSGGVITSGDTGSFITNLQTSSMSVLTSSFAITASFAVSASHEITHELSSSYAESASFAVTASHLLNNPPAFPFTGDAQITGSLTVSGSSTLTNIGPFSQTGNSTFDGNFSEPVIIISGSHNSFFGSNTIADKLRIGGNPGESFTFKYNTSTSAIGFTSPILQISGSGGSSSFNPNIILGSAAAFAPIIGDNVIVPFSFYVGSRFTNPDNQSNTKGVYQFLVSGSDGNAGGGVISLGRHGIDPSGSSDIFLNGHVQAAGHITASGNISASATSTASFGTYIGDGSGLTNISSTSLNGISLSLSSIVGDGASSAASYGTVFGKSAASTGGSNVAIGGFAVVRTHGISIGHSTNGGARTIAIGYDAGNGNGEYNVLIGDRAGTNSSGDHNIALGYLAGYDQTTGTGNITMGSGSRGIAGESNQLRIGHGIHGATISASLETGDIIFASTASAAYFVGDGSQLTGISTTPFPFTGDAQITGSLIVSGAVEFRGEEDTSTNVVIGSVLGATSANTVVIGNGAGIAFGGQRNIAIGDSATLANSTSFGVALGHSANVTGTNGIALGYSTVAQNGIALGRDAEAIGVGAIAIGRNISSTTNQLRIGDENVVISASLDTGGIIISGSLSSSKSNSTASFGTYIGDGSQLTGISGGGSAFPFTGDAVITGSLVVSGSGNQGGLRTNTRNIILGQGAGNNQDAINGPYNVMVGFQAGYTNTTGDSNVCIGKNAGYALSTNASDDNIFVGTLAGAGGTSPVARMSDANYNIGFGYESMLYLTSGDSNISFGFRTMRNISSGKYNIAFGDTALSSTDTGQDNIGIGRSAGNLQTSGTGNITIGSGSQGVAGESNQLRIGHGNTLTTISASLETGDIIFASTASAAYFVGDGSQLTGISGGGSAFPFTGDAVITGSLIVSGSGGVNIKGPFELSMTGSSGSVPFKIKTYSDSTSDNIIEIKDDGGGYDLFTFNNAGQLNLRNAASGIGGGFYIQHGGVSNTHAQLTIKNNTGFLSIKNNGGNNFQVDTKADNRSYLVGLTGNATMAIGQAAGGTAAPNEANTNTISIFNGTNPTSVQANGFAFFSNDVNSAAGTASPTFLTEDGQVLQLGVTSSLSYVSASAFKGDGSQLTGISAGSSIDTGSLGSTTITGSLTVSGSGGAIIQSSGSTVFSVIGSEGDLFTVTDNLTTGSLFSVKDISGIPLLDVTVNSTIPDVVTIGQSNLVIDSGSLEVVGNTTLTGNISSSAASTASFGTYIGDGSQLTGISAGSSIDTGSLGSTTITGSLIVSGSGTLTNIGPFSQTGDSTFTGDITASANILLPNSAQSVNFLNESGIHSRAGGSYPGFNIASGNGTSNRIWLSDTIGTPLTAAGTGPVTMSFVGLGKITGVQTIEPSNNYPLIIRGGKGPNDANDGVQMFTGDASNVYQQRFAIEADGTNVDAYFTNINGLGINDTTPSATLDVNGNINTTSHITASGNISASAFIGDGSQLTGISSGTPTLIASGSTTASAAPNTGVVIEHSGSTAFSVIGDTGTLFSIDDSLTGTLFTANDISGFPVLQAESTGEVYLGKSPQSLYTTAVVSSTTAATTHSLSTLSTSSYDGAFFEYTAVSASNARAGNIMSVWNGSNIVFTETTTTDIGNTSDLTAEVIISQSQAQFVVYSPNASYKVKTIIKAI